MALLMPQDGADVRNQESGCFGVTGSEALTNICSEMWECNVIRLRNMAPWMAERTKNKHSVVLDYLGQLVCS